MFLNWNMSPKTRWQNINGRGAYVDYRSSGFDLKNHGWEGNVLKLPADSAWDLRLSLNGGVVLHISLCKVKVPLSIIMR